MVILASLSDVISSTLPDLVADFLVGRPTFSLLTAKPYSILKLIPLKPRSLGVLVNCSLLELLQYLVSCAEE